MHRAFCNKRLLTKSLSEKNAKLFVFLEGWKFKGRSRD